jgi:hypothetical protein
VKLFGAIAFLLGTTVAATAAMIPLPRARPVDIPDDTEALVSPCRSRLAEVAAFKPLPPITGPGECTATDVVALDAVLLPDNHRVVFSPTATLRCPMAEAVTLPAQRPTPLFQNSAGIAMLTNRQAGNETLTPAARFLTK